MHLESSIVAATMQKNKLFEKRVGRSPDFGLPPAAILPCHNDCAELKRRKAIFAHSLTANMRNQNVTTAYFQVFFMCVYGVMEI